jgi:hypothetical protein
MIEKNFDFEKCVENMPRYERIKNKYSHISNVSIYCTQIKIAAEKYAEACNAMASMAGGLTLTSNGAPINSKNSFICLKDGVYWPNRDFVMQCMQVALTTGVMKTFQYFHMDIVLDELEIRLSKRK